MTEFKQIIGRGTRIDEEHGKQYFTILDFKRATELFADPDFDGDPVQIYEPGADDPPVPPDEIDDATTTTVGEFGEEEPTEIDRLVQHTYGLQPLMSTHDGLLC